MKLTKNKWINFAILKIAEGLYSATSNKYYRLMIFTIIMPINGVLMARCWWLGLLLISVQIPWAYSWAKL